MIELLIVITVLGILASIAIARYKDLVQKSQEGANRGNLASIRSALNIYYSDNEQMYPYDNLAALSQSQKYLQEVPELILVPFHPRVQTVIAETSATDSGEWSYNNDPSFLDWGKVVVGCLHSDLRGEIWTTY